MPQGLIPLTNFLTDFRQLTLGGKGELISRQTEYGLGESSGSHGGENKDDLLGCYAV
jgi:hypothetical protein